MSGLIYKDLLVMKKQLTYYLFFFVVYGVLSAVGVFPAAVLSALVAVLAMMVPMTSIAYDDQARWDKYAASTPAGRAGVVGGKYLFILLVLLACSALVTALMLVLSLAGLIQEPLPGILAAVPASAGVALVMDAVILPLLFKFGSEKSRTISMLFFVLLFGGGMLALQFFKRGGGLPQLPVWLVSALPVLLALLAVGSYLISYFISRGIYEKKEL